MNSLPWVGNPDLVSVALRHPNATISWCLRSFHNLTTQIFPSYLCGGLTEHMPPSLESPPLSVHRFRARVQREREASHRWCAHQDLQHGEDNRRLFQAGQCDREGCGGSAQASAERKQFNLEALLTTARRCRTERVMIAYLEVIL